MAPPIILDFDGVILESVSVKTTAFQKLFSFSEEHVSAIVHFHIQNGGMSRYDKFRYIYVNILKEELTGEQFDYLCNHFGELVYEEVLAAPFVWGAEEFLHNPPGSAPLYLVSATPETELHEIVKARGLSGCFRGIYGAPAKKEDCITEILTSTKSSPGAVVFIGDALNDLKAAQKTGVRFIGRVKPGDPAIFTGSTYVEQIVSDLYELNDYFRGV